MAIYASPSIAYPLNYGPLQVTKTLGSILHEPRIGADLLDPLAILDFDELAKKAKLLQDKALKKYELIEERMRTMEGINIPKSLDVMELSLVPGLVIPRKFKTLIFDKNDGTKCPNAHLTMYYRKISAYTDNDKLLIFYFKDSFTGI